MQSFELEKQQIEKHNERKEFAAKILAETIKETDQSILSFGNSLQVKVGKYNDEFYQSINKSVSSTEVTGLLTEMVSLLEEPVVDEEKTMLTKLKTLFKKEPVKNELQTTEKVDQLSVALKHTVDDLLKTIEAMDLLVGQTVESQHDISIFIRAGKIKLEQLMTNEIPYYEDLVKKDVVYLSKLTDKKDYYTKLDRRVADLQITEQFYSQQVLQIQAIKNTNQTLANKIQSTVNTTISIWKNQIALGNSLENQRVLLESQKEVTNITNKALMNNSTNLSKQTKEAAKDLKRGNLGKDALDMQREKLLTTIEEAKNIFNEGEKARYEYETNLVNFQENLETDLVSLNIDNVEKVEEEVTN